MTYEEQASIRKLLEEKQGKLWRKLSEHDISRIMAKMQRLAGDGPVLSDHWQQAIKGYWL